MQKQVYNFRTIGRGLSEKVVLFKSKFIRQIELPGLIAPYNVKLLAGKIDFNSGKNLNFENYMMKWIV